MPHSIYFSVAQVLPGRRNHAPTDFTIRDTAASARDRPLTWLGARPAAAKVSRWCDRSAVRSVALTVVNAGCLAVPPQLNATDEDDREHGRKRLLGTIRGGRKQ